MNSLDDPTMKEKGNSFNQVEIEIDRKSDILVAKEKLKKLGKKLGLSDRIDNVMIALTELCTNILKYSGEGKIKAGPPTGADPVLGSDLDRSGIEVEVTDSGPGIPDIQRAFTDGFSRSGDSRGIGLGKVNQAVDELNVSSGPRGTEITFLVWQRGEDETPVAPASPLEFGFVTRRYPGMKKNGDAFLHRTWDDRALVGVIDGVGHGDNAHLAAVKATEYINSHYDLPLETIVKGTNRACRGTRGVVAGLVRFHWEPRAVRVRYVGVGNIECIIIGPDGRNNLISKRGLLGKTCPTPKVISREWGNESERIMVLQSDGVKTHWTLDDFDGIREQSAAAIADRLLGSLERSDDDATLAAIKYLPGD